MKFIKFISTLTVTASLACFSSCSPGIAQPKGTIKGYQSARLVKRNPNALVTDDAVEQAKEKKVHGMLQKAIKHEFTSHGIKYGQPDAQLKVAYLVMIQNNAITFYYDDFFTQAGDANALSEYAHQKGAIESDRDEFFERVIIVIDVTDTKTGKLIYRNHYAHDLVDAPTDKVRNQRIQAAVKKTLAPFFKK